MRFSEEKQRERYVGHLNSFEQVRVSKEGDLKLTRMLSNIYEGTMYVAFAEPRVTITEVCLQKGANYLLKGGATMPQGCRLNPP